MNTKIAIQGFEASFHEIATRKYFGKSVDFVYCATFQALFREMEGNSTDFAVMAIENSVAGSILPNYARLRDSRLRIVGEVYLHIEMNLMALPGTKIEDIKEVHSHPMALLQCHNFFRDNAHIQLTESLDTALSAQEIGKNKIKNRGAIGSNAASDLYGLEIIRSSIETNKRNFTRFLVLQREDKKNAYVPKVIDKSSWSFRTANEPGSLAKVMTILGEKDINLTKVQSLPVLGEEWRYYFYADLEFDNIEKYHQAITESNSFISELKILGEYQQGEKYL